MDSYVKNQLKRKVSSFILSEAGKVGNRNTFSAAALVTASSLAAVMVSVKSARADPVDCGTTTCDDNQFLYCCVEHHDPGGDFYFCENSSPAGHDACWSL